MFVVTVTGFFLCLISWLVLLFHSRQKIDWFIFKGLTRNELLRMSNGLNSRHQLWPGICNNGKALCGVWSVMFNLYVVCSCAVEDDVCFTFFHSICRIIKELYISQEFSLRIYKYAIIFVVSIICAIHSCTSENHKVE